MRLGLVESSVAEQEARVFARAEQERLDSQ